MLICIWGCSLISQHDLDVQRKLGSSTSVHALSHITLNNTLCWVGQKVHSGFFCKMLQGKNSHELFDQPNTIIAQTL